MPTKLPRQPSAPSASSCLRMPHERGEHLVVLRVEGVEDGARERVVHLKAVEEPRKRLRHVPLADAVEAGVGPQQLEHLRVRVAQAAVVELRRPAGFRVRRQSFVEPRALQLERLFGSERLYRGVTAEEREGRTEERGNLELCDEVEEQGAETSHEKGC